MTKARENSDYTGLQGDLAGLQTNITAGDTAARAGRKNLFINGGCQVGQRGNVALSNSVVKYGACDRWGMYPNVSGTHSATSSQATVTWSESGNAIGWTAVTTVQAGQMLTRQFIESSNVRHLTGKKLTCSFKVFHDVGADVSVNVLTLKPNSKDNFASTTDLTSNTTIATAASGVVTEVSYTWPNALTAADCVNGFCVTIQLATSTSVTNKNFYVADLQLEEGSVATDFEHRSYGEELQLCKRYFNSESSHDRHSVKQYHPSYKELAIAWPVEMRAAPTFSYTISGGGTTAGYLTNKRVFRYVASGVSDTTAYYIHSYIADAEL